MTIGKIEQLTVMPDVERMQRIVEELNKNSRRTVYIVDEKYCYEGTGEKLALDVIADPYAELGKIIGIILDCPDCDAGGIIRAKVQEWMRHKAEAENDSRNDA